MFQALLNPHPLTHTRLQVLLNSRLSASLEDNWKLEDMLSSNKVLKLSGADRNRTFEANLRATHEWYDRWATTNLHHPHAVPSRMLEMQSEARIT